MAKQKTNPRPQKSVGTDILGNRLNLIQRSAAWINRRVGLDSVDASYSDSVDWSTLRQPTTKGLFGGTIEDKELLFGVQREPAAHRIVFGVARDALDNWFKVVDLDGKDAKMDDDLQQEFNRLHAKIKLIQLLGLDRLYGWSLLLLGHQDGSESLDTEVTEGENAPIQYIEPYAKTAVRKVIEVNDPEDERDKYPKFYDMKAGRGTKKVHYSRAIHCATNLVDHRWQGWSQLQVIYDDLTGFRYMRWGVYMTMIRYGSGFPDITLKGEEANQAAIDAFIASKQFDNVNSMTYFVHNETQEMDFKGVTNSTLNPLNYYQIALESLSLGSGIPEPVLRGAQAGALTGSEINERAYFKVISDVQSAFEPILRQLIDKILAYKRAGKNINYKVMWNPGFEPTAKEKAELELLVSQTAQNLGAVMQVDEIRKRLFELKPLPNKEGQVVSGLSKAPETSFPPLSSPYSPAGPASSSNGAPKTSETDLAAEKRSEASTDADDTTTAAAAGAKKGPDVKPKPTLVTLLTQIGKDVISGAKSKEQAVSEGNVIISDFAKLEEQHAILYIQHRARSPKPVALPPELASQLRRQQQTYFDDFKNMMDDAEKLYKQNQQKADQP